MKGFTRISDPGLLEPGDVLLIPPEAKSLHVSAKTLSRHGLSNGETTRGLNSSALVDRVFRDTQDTGCALMVATCKTHDLEVKPRKGVNTLNVAAQPTKKLCSFSAHPLDGDLLPTVHPSPSEWTNPRRKDPSYVLASIPPLVDAVREEFMANAKDAMWSALNPFPRYFHARESDGWTALRRAVEAPFGPGDATYALPLAPGRWLSPSKAESIDERDERMTRRLFRNESMYGWKHASREMTLYVHDAAVQYMFSHGMEIHRPDPETWTALARRVLAQHAQAVLAEIRDVDQTIDKFTRQMRTDVQEFSKFKASWTAAAKAYAADVPLRSPYKKHKETT